MTAPQHLLRPAQTSQASRCDMGLDTHSQREAAAATATSCPFQAMA